MENTDKEKKFFSKADKVKKYLIILNFTKT